MKKFFFVLAIGAFAACNNSSSTETKTDSSVVKDSVTKTVDTLKQDSTTVIKDTVKKDTTKK
jgi:ABC-type transporter MlaC component